MKEKTSYKLIGLAALILGVLWTGKHILKDGLEYIKPFADNQVTYNQNLMKEYQEGKKKGVPCFQTSAIDEYYKQGNQYNKYISYSKKIGLLAAGVAVAGALSKGKKDYQNP